MLDASEKLMEELTRPNGHQARGLLSVTEVLVSYHGRNADQIPGLPCVPLVLLHVVSITLNHEKQLLKDVPVPSRVSSGLDLLNYKI